MTALALNTPVTQFGDGVFAPPEVFALRDRTVRETPSLECNFVLEFARARIKQIDASLKRQLDVIKASGLLTGALNDVLVKVSQFSGGIGNAAGKAALTEAITQAIADLEHLPEGAQLQAKLREMRDSPSGIINVGGDDIISEAEMSGLKTQLEGELKKVDSAQQEEQLTINMRMGQRNEILQLAASLIQALNETVKGILGRS